MNLPSDSILWVLVQSIFLESIVVNSLSWRISDNSLVPRPNIPSHNSNGKVCNHVRVWWSYKYICSWHYYLKVQTVTLIIIDQSYVLIYVRKTFIFIIHHRKTTLFTWYYFVPFNRPHMAKVVVVKHSHGSIEDVSKYWQFECQHLWERHEKSKFFFPHIELEQVTSTDDLQTRKPDVLCINMTD